MANIQIPNLPAAINLNGLEQLEIVQDGVSRRTTTLDIANLTNLSPMQAQIAALQTNVANLLNVPCASFYSKATQNHGAIGAEAIVSCNNTDFQYGITLVSNTQFTANVNGIYNIQFSLQLVAPNNNKRAYVWLKKNGVLVPNSNTEIDLPNKDYGYVAAWNFMLPLNAGQYVQLAWTSDDGVTLKAVTSPPYGPAIPSVITTMNLVRRT